MGKGRLLLTSLSSVPNAIFASVTQTPCTAPLISEIVPRLVASHNAKYLGSACESEGRTRVCQPPPLPRSYLRRQPPQSVPITLNSMPIAEVRRVRMGSFQIWCLHQRGKGVMEKRTWYARFSEFYCIKLFQVQTRGRGSKNTKILQTSFMESP